MSGEEAKWRTAEQEVIVSVPRRLRGALLHDDPDFEQQGQLQTVVRILLS